MPGEPVLCCDNIQVGIVFVILTMRTRIGFESEGAMLSKYITIPIFLLVVLALALPSSSAQTAPGQAGIPPYAGAPLCPTHEDRQFHSLWDSVRGCHYDHTHHDDPSLADHLFGVAGEEWGQNLSYPWMTKNENDDHGHPGYKYYVNLAPYPPGEQFNFAYLDPDPHFVRAFRIQYHDVGGNAHLVKRFHSYYMEVQVQSRTTGEFGTVSFGGWADFGCLHLPYKKDLLLLPGIDPQNPDGSDACGTTQKLGQVPYRAGSTLDLIASRKELMQRDRIKDNKWIWTSHDRWGYNQLGYFFFRTLDSWTGMDRNDPYAEHFICPDFQCKFNNSEHHIHNVVVQIPESLDVDGDGVVNYEGYTDIQGNIVTGCTSPSADCVPLSIVNGPVGKSIWNVGGGPRPQGEIIRDHDLSPDGEHWIVFHGHANAPVPMNVHTREVTPTENHRRSPR